MRKIHYLPGRQFGFNTITGILFRVAMMRLIFGGGGTPIDYSDLVDEAIVDFSRVGTLSNLIGEALVDYAEAG